jgi:hypothetical protein
MAVAALTCPALDQAQKRGVKHPTVRYVSGRLNTPVPLGRPLTASVSGSQKMEVSLFEEDKPVVSGQVEIIDQLHAPGSTIATVPEHLVDIVQDMAKGANANLTGETLVEQQGKIFRDASITVNNDCYGCSEKPHALKLRNRKASNGDLWTRWHIDAELADDDERLSVASIVAALDCSNLWVINARYDDLGLKLREEDDKTWITGTHAVHFIRVPPLSEDYRIVTRYLRTEGRKSFTTAVLCDQDGEIYAVAEAISILIDYLPEMR